MEQTPVRGVGNQSHNAADSLLGPFYQGQGLPQNLGLQNTDWGVPPVDQEFNTTNIASRSGAVPNCQCLVLKRFFKCS